MKPIQLFDPASSTYTYVLFDPATRQALIIDPVDEQIERDLACLKDHGLQLAWTVETHAHADHITSAGQLAEQAELDARVAEAHAQSVRSLRSATESQNAARVLQEEINRKIVR